LAGINVMDYSFVVGVDNKNNELVVGIIGKHFEVYEVHRN
jgi:hypothetical protein